MMTTLHNASRRGVPIVVFNPLKERALERFAAPQDPVEMVTLSSTPIASAYHQLRTGGDLAALKGMMKAVFERDAANIAAGGPGVLDRAFIEEHTAGLDALARGRRSRELGPDRRSQRPYQRAQSTVPPMSM